MCFQPPILGSCQQHNYQTCCNTLVTFSQNGTGLHRERREGEGMRLRAWPGWRICFRSAMAHSGLSVLQDWSVLSCLQVPGPGPEGPRGMGRCLSRREKLGNNAVVQLLPLVFKPVLIAIAFATEPQYVHVVKNGPYQPKKQLTFQTCIKRRI